VVLHPALAQWFDSRFPSYTEIQRKALKFTLAGKNALLLAPTGSGKTLAAFLSVLSDLASRELPNAVCAVYVSPLKALGRDIRRNLEGPLSVLPGIRMDVRTGDTLASERTKQQRQRPHLLLTTPESLSAILSQSGWVFDVRTVIVDEIHSFAEGKRGALLSLALERLEARARGPMQRVGVSATAHPVDAIARLLCGARPCEVAKVDLKKAHRLEIATPPPDLWLPPAGHNPFRVAHPVADLVNRAQCSLVFTSTRSAAERLGLALKILLPEFDEKIEVHHGSLDPKARQAIESALSEGSLKAVVCSSSLELGVDFQAVDQVLLIGAPRGVSRALQRLGRSGHRVDGVATGALVPLSLPDLVQCVALRHASQVGLLDPLRPPEAPLDVLAQVLLGMSIERAWPVDEAFELVRKAGPYQRLTRQAYDDILEYLAGGGKVLGGYGTYGKILIEDGKFRVASKKVAREYYMNTGVISDSLQIQLLTRANHRLGEVEEDFLASLQQGEAFLIGGKPVAVKSMFQNKAVVVPASGERVTTPRWMGGKMPLTASLAAEELRLRAALRSAWERGGKADCVRVLKREWKVPEGAAERIGGFLEHQMKAAPIPVEVPVQLERITNRRNHMIIFHVVRGRAVNRSLAWVLAARLAQGGSIAANFDDHALLLSMNAKEAPTWERLRAGFDPASWGDALRQALETTETLGRRFRAVAEVGQLLPRRTFRGNVSAKSSSWSGSLLYKTLKEHEPDHPLVREAVREVLEDECDAEAAAVEAWRIFEAEWECFDLPRASPFALPLFAAFNRETLIAADPEKALDELVASLYDDWDR
jgi:ATP-dependent Lhr-like helicase